MKWLNTSFIRNILITIILTILFALAPTPVLAYDDTGDGGGTTNPANAYCDTSYTSPWDGTPQYPVGCPPRP